MIEIELIIDGTPAFEYQTHLLPRIGECLDINHEWVVGTYQVEKVIHRIFQDKKDKRIHTYAKVYATFK